LQSLRIFERKFEVVYGVDFGVKITVKEVPEEAGKGKRELGSFRVVGTKENPIEVDMEAQHMKDAREDLEDVNLLTLESVRTETKTSQGYESSCIFKEVVLLFG
jgi:hypothetical protein